MQTVSLISVLTLLEERLNAPGSRLSPFGPFVVRISRWLLSVRP